MELSITGEFAKQLFAKSKKDERLARAMAKEFLGAIEPAFMAEFLLKPEIAVAILAAKLQKDPEGTIKQLQQLPTTQPGARRGRPRGKPAGRSAGARKPTARRGGGGIRRRRRLTSEQVASLKAQVKAFLGKHPWSTRKELTSRIDLPTQAIYRRIMVELQDTGIVIARGEKAKAVYALKGTKVGAKPKAAPKKSRPKKIKTKATQKSKAKKETPKAAGKTAKKAGRKKRAPVLCPVPGCKNKGAPVFGMLCKEHSKISKEERAKLFAARRKK